MTGQSFRGAALNALDRAQSVLALALAPGGMRALLTWRPRSAAAFRITMTVARSGAEPATIIDVGANVGQFSRAALGRWPTARVFAFEPLPDAAATTRRMLARMGDDHAVYQVALGSREGATVFRRHQYSLSSSVLAVTEPLGDQYPWANEGELITVPITRLDRVLSDVRLNRPVLIKIDVQGYEAEVLSGASAVLDAADILIIEHAFEEFYEGQPRAAEVMEHLLQSGWQVNRVADVRREGGVIVEADMVYGRRVVTED